MAALNFTTMVHGLGQGAASANAYGLTQRRNCDKCTPGHSHDLASQGHLLRGHRDGLIKPILGADTPTTVPVRCCCARLTLDITHIPSGTEESPGHRQHLVAACEKGKGEYFAVELHQGLILAVGNIAKLSAASYHHPRNVRHRLVRCAARHEVRETTCRRAIPGVPLADGGLPEGGSLQKLLFPTLGAVLTLWRGRHKHCPVAAGEVATHEVVTFPPKL
mmetsp:Transcript_81058/g.173299  ORF Transcript_81058/g.173299 Transcript_81058/m.173299 type:complete len:220 (-) Transcript_81058:894-1553(-)